VLGAFDPPLNGGKPTIFLYADGNLTSAGRDLQGVFLRLATEWDGFAANPHSIRCRPSRSSSRGRYSGAYKATGKKLDAQFAHFGRWLTAK